MRQLAILATAIALGIAFDSHAQREDEPPPRTVHDPSEALPSRNTGEAVLSGREAFDREEAQIQIGTRRRDAASEQVDTSAQLAGDEQTLRHSCEIGERVELVGHRNIVEIDGDCVGLSITGNGNQVVIEVVDDIRIEGADNDIRWQRGFTAARPNTLETGGRNSVARKAQADGG